MSTRPPWLRPWPRAEETRGSSDHASADARISRQRETGGADGTVRRIHGATLQAQRIRLARRDADTVAVALELRLTRHRHAADPGERTARLARRRSLERIRVAGLSSGTARLQQCAGRARRVASVGASGIASAIATWGVAGISSSLAIGCCRIHEAHVRPQTDVGRHALRQTVATGGGGVLGHPASTDPATTQHHKHRHDTHDPTISKI